MNAKFYFLLLIATLQCASSQTSRDDDFDMDALRKHSIEANQRYSEKIQKREGSDKPWMLLVLKKVHDGDRVSDDELQRVWEIYRTEKNHTPEDKLIAFRLIAEVEDISKWQKEFDDFAYSKDPSFVKAAIQLLLWKLYQGSEREKIILSNRTDVLEHLVKFAEANKADTTIDRDAVKINELTKPYVEKTPPVEVQRPDHRSSGSTADAMRLPNERTPDSSKMGSLVQRIGKGGSLVFAGIIGIIIAAILTWRWKSRSTS